MRAKIIDAMKQADMVLKLTTKRRRKREFLAEMERVVPWAALVVLIVPPPSVTYSTSRILVED
jgi:IS5 family transposase